MPIPEKQYASLMEATSESTDVIQYKEIDTPQITGPHDLIIKNKYSGVNFLEVYFRKGLFPTDLPMIFGREATGVVVAVGSDVKDYKEGDKVLYMSPNTFAQYTKVDLSKNFQIHKLPENTPDEKLKLFGSVLIQGLTAITFATEAHPVKKGEYVAIWAAAGGTGLAFTQYVTALGGRVIAFASSDVKLKQAKDLGAEFLVNSLTDDIPKKISEITNGHGVDVIFDGVGRAAFEVNLEILAHKGTFVSFGTSSGTLPPLEALRLSTKNIRFLSPGVFGYVAAKEDWEKYITILIDQVNSGKLKYSIETYDLKDYAKATAALEARKTTGKLVLEIPQ